MDIIGINCIVNVSRHTNALSLLIHKQHLSGPHGLVIIILYTVATL